VLAVGDRRAEDAVRPVPHLPPRERVQRVRAPVALLGVTRGDAAAPRAGGEVDEAVDHARRAVDGRRSGKAPEAIAGRGVEGHEVPVVRTDVDALPPDGGRGVDVGAGALGPEQPSARRTEGVERPVGVADVNPAVRDRRGRVEVLAAAEAGEGLRPPALPPGACVERVDASGVRAEVDLPVRVRGRAVDLVVGGERPARLPCVDVDRVELVIPGPGVERLADHERRGLEGAGPEAPDDLPGAGRHRRDHPRLAPGVAVAGKRLHPGVVDDAVGDRRRRCGAVVEPSLPDDLPRPVMDGVEPAALLREVQTAVGDRGRELEDVAGLERPAETERRAEPEVRGGVRPLHPEPVRRPGKPQHDSPRTRFLGRPLRCHELDGGRALLVVDRALLVEPDAGEEAGDDRGNGEDREREEAAAVHGLRTTTSAVSRRPETSTTSE
jgi:hypothetical protein